MRTSQGYLTPLYKKYVFFENGEKTMKTHEYIELAKYYNLSLDYIAGLIDTPLKLF